MLNISNFYEDLTVKLEGGDAVDELLITFFHVVIWPRNFQKIGEIESKQKSINFSAILFPEKTLCTKCS